MGRRLGISDLPAREEIKESRVDGIMNNGIDNAYPTRMERILEGSISAKSCSDILARFIIGSGFVNQELNDLVVGYENYRPITAYKLLTRMARSFARNNGYFVQAQFNPALETVGFKCLNFGYCRFSKVDDVDHAGKVVIYNNWDRSNGKKVLKSNFKYRDVWNPNKDVLLSQIKAAGDIKKYKGQVYFDFLEDDYIYPLSPIDAVQFDADSEDQVSKFKNGELRKGFFLKYIIHHSEFDNDEDAMAFNHMLNKFNGGDYSSSALLLEGKFDATTGEFLKDENIKIEKLEQNINDKLFDTYQKSWANNIRKAYDAIPSVLIDYDVSPLGSMSGDAIQQASEYYNIQTQYRRAFISESFRNMFKNWKDPQFRGKRFEIKPLQMKLINTTENGTVD